MMFIRHFKVFNYFFFRKSLVAVCMADEATIRPPIPAIRPLIIVPTPGNIAVPVAAPAHMPPQPAATSAVFDARFSA